MEILNSYLLTEERDNVEYVLSLFSISPSNSLIRDDIPNITEEQIKTLKKEGICIVNSKKYILIQWE